MKSIPLVAGVALVSAVGFGLVEWHARRPPTHAPASPPRSAAPTPWSQAQALGERWRRETDSGRQREREDELAALLDALSPADFLRALPAALRETPVALTALARWAESDPAAALAWLEQSPPAAGRLELVMRTWQARDEAAVRRHLGMLPAGEWKDRLLNAAAQVALRGDHPELALDWLMQASAERVDTEVLDAAARLWGRRDAAAAALWATEQSNPAIQDRLLAQAAVGHAARDPAAALDFVERILPEGDAKGQAAEAIFSAWSKLDPATAVEHAILWTNAEKGPHVVDYTLYAWREADAAAVRTWVTALPAGAERDYLSSRLVQWEMESNPRAAFALARQIATGPWGEEAGLRALRQWARADIVQARASVASLPPGNWQQKAFAVVSQASAHFDPDRPESE